MHCHILVNLNSGCMTNRLLTRAFLFAFAIAILQSCKNSEPIRPVTPPVVPTLSPCGSAVSYGYTDKVSYFPGDDIEVFLQSSTTLNCGLDFYDIKGSVAFSSNVPLFTQLIWPTEPWANGYNFQFNGKIKLPSSTASGIYYIENKIPFVVKSATPAEITVVYPVNTINAYCNSGGESMYGFNSTNLIASRIVSFLRPLTEPTEEGACSECLKWLPSLPNLKINYVSDLDLNDYTSFQSSKVLLIVGHSEYWTRNARKNFDRFVNAGKNAIVLSGNTMWWQGRYSAKRDALICHRIAQLDPEPDPAMKTILWVDPSLQYSILSSIGADFNHGGYGLKSDNGWDGFKISNPASPLLQGLNVKRGDIISLPTGEYDGAPVISFDAAGFPVLDNGLLKFEKLELIGFDKGSRVGKETIGTFIVFQKTKTSGIIINAGSNSWCSLAGIGSSYSGDQLKKITSNAITKLLVGDPVFSK